MTLASTSERALAPLPGGDAFVGREAELAALAGHLERARSGSPQVVLIEGAPGVGKTALLDAFLRRAGPGVRVLRAGGEQAEELVSFGLVEQLVGATGPAAVAAVRAAEEPPAVGAALVELVGGLARSGPVVLVLDDAHWADLPSVQAVVFALRRLRSDAVLTLVAAREPADPRIERLRNLAAGSGGARMRVRGLDVPALIELGEALGAGRLPLPAARRLHAHTGGVPLHATALFEEVEPAALRAADGPLPSPASYSLLVVGRLSECPPATRRLVVAAAVLGERCPLEVARQLAGGVGLEAVDNAVAAKLLTVTLAGNDTTLGFPHALVRTAVYHDLDITTRLALHTRAAELLTGRDALAHRVAAAVGADPGLAAELESVAADLAARGEPAAAAASLVSAARLHGDVAARERCLLDAVELLVLAGDGARALSLAADVAACRAGTRRYYVQALLEFAAGRPADAEAPLVAAWERSTPGDRALRATIAGRLCQVCYLQLRSEEAVEWGARGRAEDPRFSSWLVTSMALAGRPPESRLLPGDDAADDLEAAVARGTQRLWTEDLAGARAELAVAVAGLRRRGMFLAGLQAQGYLALAEFRSGAWDDAVAHAEEAVSLARDADQSWTLARLHSYAAFPHAARGDWEHADAHVAAAHEAAAATGLRLDVVGATIAEANVAAARGDHAAVVAALEPLARGSRGAGEPGVSVWPCLLADAMAHLGRLDDAEQVLAPYERSAAERGRRRAQAAAARARGRLEALRGQPDRAEAALRAAVAHADEAGAEVELLLGRAALGAFLRRAGRRRAAAAELRAARAGLLRLGAQPLVARCDRELEACGLSPDRRGHGAAGSAGGASVGLVGRLTPRELCVARLVAGGLSNPQVAAELIVSLNTVEFHLRNVFAKLGVTSRTEIAGHLDP
jgi:DNA-binding NarL/FixJ family response regulator